MVSWDDSVECGTTACLPPNNPADLDYLVKGLKNKNDLDYKYTFFVRHEYTDYSVVENYFAAGHDIASHTVSHRTPVDYFQDANKTRWEQEILDQNKIINLQTTIPVETITGFRAPYLAMNEVLYEVLHENNFTWESSVPIPFPQDCTGECMEQIWPYTLDFGAGECDPTEKCPKESYPGLWEVPLNPVYKTGYKCDQHCDIEGLMAPYPGEQAATVVEGLEYNFNKNYNGNRAPFGIYLHTSWLSDKSKTNDTDTTQHAIGLRNFLEGLAAKEDVWVVTIPQVIEWMKTVDPATGDGADPATLFAPAHLPERQPARCDVTNNTACKGGLKKDWGYACQYWKTCNAECPQLFPWIGNVDGKGTPKGCFSEGLTEEQVDRRAEDDAKEEAAEHVAFSRGGSQGN